MSRFAGIDGLLQGAADAGAVPGVVAIVAGPDGVLYEGAAGAATPDTMFRFASMTKAMASVAALALVEEGRLDLDQTVESVLPEFGELQVLESCEGGTPRLRPPASQATIRQLMNHTAGCGYWFGSEDLKRYHEITGEPNMFSGLRGALNAPLVFDPGTTWNYGINTDWLGQVVEKIEGKGLDAVLADRIWGPLGMTDATFELSDEQRGRLMPVAQRQADGSLAPSPHDIPADPEFCAAGHGSYGTGRDYGKFVAMLLRGGSPVLSAETVELAFTDQLDGIALPERTLSTEPELVNEFDALPFPQGWGLGFHLTLVDLEGMRHAGTGDWAGLFNCFFWVDRAAGVGGILLTQVLPFFDAGVIELLVGFEQAVYAAVGAPTPA
jgi:CubicO group peptidase (beta-lactamase class C family)